MSKIKRYYMLLALYAISFLLVPILNMYICIINGSNTERNWVWVCGLIVAVFFSTIGYITFYLYGKRVMKENKKKAQV